MCESCVSDSHTTSNWSHVKSGGPQGSFHRPILLLITLIIVLLVAIMIAAKYFVLIIVSRPRYNLLT